jgi:lysophospholipase L1-like esterase
MIWTALPQRCDQSVRADPAHRTTRLRRSDGVPGAPHAGGGGRLRVRLTNRHGRTPLTVAAAALVAGFTELARRAHEADLRILAATIGPFAGAIYPGVSTPEGLAARREVNDWIRSTEVFDAVVDVARAVEDPDAPDHIHPDLDAGDGMHLNDAGARAMAEAVDPRTLVLEGR